MPTMSCLTVDRFVRRLNITLFWPIYSFICSFKRLDGSRVVPFQKGLKPASTLGLLDIESVDL